MSPAGLHDYHALRSPIPRGSTTNNTPCPPPAEGERSCPTTPHAQRPPPITRTRFSLLRFRSPLLTEYLLLRVLRCFTSPRSLQLPYTFRQRSPDTTPEIQGFPIRKSQDHSSFTNSPGLIAGYNVLHRLLVPRHPPIALSSLPKHNNKIYKDARVHYKVLKTHTPKNPPKQKPGDP